MDPRRVRLTPSTTVTGRYGEGALLIQAADPVAVAAAARALPGVTDAVPGDGCVVVRGVRDLDLDDLPPSPTTAREHLLEIVYDGPDLPGLPAAAAALHAAGTYRVAFLGFAPGFAYLDGLHPTLHGPRLPTPRPRVPAGSVGIAGERTCVYPSESPGGWHLVGRVTDPAALFDATRADRPALLAPGDTVRFRGVG